MYAVSDRFLTAVRQSHVSSIKVEIYNAGTQQLLSIPKVIGGEVTIDSRRDIRRQCKLEFVDTDGTLLPTNKISSILLPFNREVRIYRGVLFDDGTEELVPLGVFIITSVEVSDSTQGVRITVEGSDRSLRVQKAKWTNHAFYIDDQTPKEDAVKKILVDRYPGVKTLFPATNQVTQILYPSLDQSSNPWKEALKIAESAGMDLYFDELGIARMRSIPNPDTTVSVATYQDGIDSVLTSLSRALTTDESFNYVIYTGEGTNLSIGVIGEAWDDNPNSPTYRYTYGEVPIFKSSPTILTVAEATEAAQAELRKVIGATEKINWNQIVNPAHDAFDVVKIVRSESGVDATLMIDSLTIPLSPKDSMSAIGRTRRF
jgi:hypothetical protein